MKTLELEPTIENIKKTLQEDLFNRNKLLWRFVQFCNLQNEKCSIAIDSTWGNGKTFFIRQAKMIIDSFNNFTNTVLPDDKEHIKKIFDIYKQEFKALENNCQVTAYYDAWKNDNDEDPILSIVYEIICEFYKNYSLSENKNKLKDIVVALAETISSLKIKDFLDIFKKENFLEEIKRNRDIHDIVNDFLEELLIERGNRLVIFIDELDRCKPIYAVRLLERIKHYFSNDKITFVFAVNMMELQHTIKSCYGNDYDGCRYLDRFFDYRISLPAADLNRYYEILKFNSDNWVFDRICDSVIRTYSFGIRECEKYVRMVKIAAFKRTHSRNDEPMFPEKYASHLSEILFVPIMVGLLMSDINKYKEFIEGKGFEQVEKVLGDAKNYDRLCEWLLTPSEKYNKNTESTYKQVSVINKIKEAYFSLFDGKLTDDYKRVTVGKCEFSRDTKQEIMNVISLLSEFAIYN